MFDSLYVTQKVFFQKVSLSSMNHLKTHTLRDWSKSMGGGGGWAGAERGWVMRFLALCKGWVVQFSVTLRGWVTLFYCIDRH